MEIFPCPLLVTSRTASRSSPCPLIGCAVTETGGVNRLRTPAVDPVSFSPRALSLSPAAELGCWLLINLLSASMSRAIETLTVLPASSLIIALAPSTSTSSPLMVRPLPASVHVRASRTTGRSPTKRAHRTAGRPTFKLLITSQRRSNRIFPINAKIRARLRLPEAENLFRRCGLMSRRAGLQPAGSSPALAHQSSTRTRPNLREPAGKGFESRTCTLSQISSICVTVSLPPPVHPESRADENSGK